MGFFVFVFRVTWAEDPLEEEMATHSSILAWRIPGREEPGGLQSMGFQRVGHDWAHKHGLSYWNVTYLVKLYRPFHYVTKGFLGGKESTCQCSSCKRCGFDPWVGKIPWCRKWQLYLVFLPGKSHGQRNLVGCNPWGLKRVRCDWASMHIIYKIMHII